MDDAAKLAELQGQIVLARSILWSAVQDGERATAPELWVGAARAFLAPPLAPPLDPDEGAKDMQCAYLRAFSGPPVDINIRFANCSENTQAGWHAVAKLAAGRAKAERIEGMRDALRVCQTGGTNELAIIELIDETERVARDGGP